MKVEQPILSYPTRLDAWYLEKKELNKKINETKRKNAVGSEA